MEIKRKSGAFYECSSVKYEFGATLSCSLQTFRVSHSRNFELVVCGFTGST